MLLLVKLLLKQKKIEDNASELLKTIQKMRPSSIKGTYIKSIFMSSTMSPSINIETKIA
jgi:large subunit ribosomal protein L1